MKKRLSKKSIVIVSFIIFLLIVLIVWTVWENGAIAVSDITVFDGSVPQSFDGFRIAHISDLHNAEFGEGNKNLLSKISEQDPDIIVITGDLVDSSHTDIEIALDFAGKAVDIAPVYYVTGNHEAHISEYDRLKDGLEALNVTVLDDSSAILERGGDKITLLGLADPNFTVKGDMLSEIPAMIYAKLNYLYDESEGFAVLLSHRPELFDVYAEFGINLILSGHTHGGQFRLPFVGGVVAPNQGLFPKYDAGLYTSGSSVMIVSRGLGNSIIPFRFNNRPEIVMIELRIK